MDQKPTEVLEIVFIISQLSVCFRIRILQQYQHRSKVFPRIDDKLWPIGEDEDEIDDSGDVVTGVGDDILEPMWRVILFIHEPI